MKLSLLTLTAALTASSAFAAGPVRKSIKLGDRSLRRGDPATEALMKKARPYKQASGKVSTRKLEGDIDGSYSLKFSQCLDIKTYDQDTYANYAELIQAGTIVSTKSYVLFHVCQDDSCYYESEDDLYIVDLPTYLGTVATYFAEKKTNYCEACQQFEEQCNPQEEEAAEQQEADQADQADQAEEADQAEQADEAEQADQAADEEGADEQANEGRKLKVQRRAKVAIDCDQCQSYECYAEDDGNNLDEQAAEWIRKLAECELADNQVDGANVYFGAMCDDYGDGVELAVFLDEGCSLYDSQLAFNNIYLKEDDGDAYGYLTYAETYIKAAFSDTMSCYEPEYYVANGDDAVEEDDVMEISEYCDQILKDNAANYNECQASEDEQQVTEDGYVYDIQADDNLDIAEVCSLAKRMAAGGSYYHAYDQSGSGTWYVRDKSGNIVLSSERQTGLAGGAIFGIVALVVAAVAGVAFLVLKRKKRGDIAESAEYHGGALS